MNKILVFFGVIGCILISLIFSNVANKPIFFVNEELDVNGEDVNVSNLYIDGNLNFPVNVASGLWNGSYIDFFRNGSIVNQGGSMGFRSVEGIDFIVKGKEPEWVGLQLYRTAVGASYGLDFTASNTAWFVFQDNLITSNDSSLGTLNYRWNGVYSDGNIDTTEDIMVRGNRICNEVNCWNLEKLANESITWQSAWDNDPYLRMGDTNTLVEARLGDWLFMNTISDNNFFGINFEKESIFFQHTDNNISTTASKKGLVFSDTVHPTGVTLTDLETNYWSLDSGVISPDNYNIDTTDNNINVGNVLTSDSESCLTLIPAGWSHGYNGTTQQVSDYTRNLGDQNAHFTIEGFHELGSWFKINSVHIDFKRTDADSYITSVHLHENNASSDGMTSLWSNTTDITGAVGYDSADYTPNITIN